MRFHCVAENQSSSGVPPGFRKLLTPRRTCGANIFLEKKKKKKNRWVKCKRNLSPNSLRDPHGSALLTPAVSGFAGNPPPPSPLEKPEVPQENLQGPKTEERKNVFFPAPLWGLKQSLLAHSFIHSAINIY